MIIVICGVNWPATWSVARLIETALTATNRTTAICEAPDLEEIGSFVLRRSEDILLMTVRWMTPALIEALPHSAAPVVQVDAPASALFAHWMEHTEQDPMAALREVVRDLAPLSELLRLRDTLRFEPAMAGNPARCLAFLAALAASDTRLAGLGQSVDTPGINWPDSAPFAAGQVADADVAAMLSALDAGLSSRVPQPLPVPVRLMLQPGFQPLDGPIDLTGSPRGLFFGPLIPLPSGVWTVTVVIVCRGVMQKPKVIMDAAHLLESGPEILGQCEFALVSDGRMRISYSFVNPAPNRRLEFRMLLPQAVFDGSLTLEALTLVPSDDAADQEAADA